MSQAVFYRSGEELWFLGFYSNNFSDVEDEILTEEAHEEYAQWVKQTGVTLPITVLHQPHYDDVVHVAHYLGLVRGQISPTEFSANLKTMYQPFAIAEAKAVISVNGFNIVIGKVYDNKRQIVERLTERSDSWGMSHGFLNVKSSGNIIEKYRTFEFTVLPSEIAANQITPIGFVRRENEMAAMLKGMNDEDRKLLQSLLDDSVNPDEIEQATEKAKAILAQVLGSKAVEEAADEADEEKEEEVQEAEEKAVEEPVDEKAMPYAEIRLKLMDDFKLKELNDTLTAVADRFATVEAALKGLGERLEVAEEAQKKTEDDVIASAFVAPAWTPTWGNLSVQGKQVTEEKSEEELLEELKKDLPAEADKKAAEDNMLVKGFWNQF